MRRSIGKRMMSLILATSMIVSSSVVLSACGKKSNKPVTLTVYSQLANYSGLQLGWSADILLKKFNVKLNIIPETSGTFQTRMESGDLGDIVVLGSADNYKQAVLKNMLFDWNKNDLLSSYGSYIKDNMKDALSWNQQLTKTYTNGKSDTIYGFGFDVATSSKDHETFMYTWDIRWDLYKQLGYPEVKDMSDMEVLLKNMQKLEPKDEAGDKEYAVSLWPDWDAEMVMYVKSTATSYYGYDELGIGLYDPSTGNYHDCLEEGGPYLTMLKWYNQLYQDGLVDPDSMTQTCDNAGEKMRNGGVLFSIFNYAGSMQYNTAKHKKAGKMMESLKPTEAKPIVYGMNTSGGERIWTIGANSQYPDLAMEVINYMCTPEGYMNMAYGPKGETWNYDEDGNTYFTDLGKKCHADGKTVIGNGHKGSYADGQLQINNTTWSLDSDNPDSNGETYNSDNWKSNQTKTEYAIEQDWIDHTGCNNTDEYFEKGSYMLMPAINYSATSKTDELKTTWSQVTNSIRKGSWNALYAKTETEYNKIVANMIKETKSYGYDDCLEWSKNEAATKTKLISELKQ